MHTQTAVATGKVPYDGRHWKHVYAAHDNASNLEKKEKDADSDYYYNKRLTC